MQADILAWSVPVLFCSFALLFLLLSRLHRSLLWWSVAFLIASVGFAMTVLPTTPGSVLKPTVEDTMFLVALSITNGAFAARAGRRPRWTWPTVLVVAGSAGAAGSLAFLGGSVLYEVMSVQSACAGLMLLSAYEMRHDTAALKPLLFGLCLTIAGSLGFQNLLLLSAPPGDLTVSAWRDTTWGFVFQLNGAAMGLLLATSVILTTTLDIIARLREESTADALTGVLNRRGLEQGVEAMRKGARMPTRFALILSDLDHFKSINDRFGHEAGDAVLCGYAALCAEIVGRDGLVARIGGEEFAIVLAGSDRRAAIRVAEVLRSTASRVRWPGRLAEVRITASFGVVDLDGDETLFGAIDRADRLLYRAKADGRDKVMVEAWEPPMQPPTPLRHRAGAAAG
ncbi:GGDEF domain-containing protein [Aureimonas sp. AU22]|uniref:GGDEF domain-containing protein n=1 Tax=Aureimonas sp. AU22 TaxID=1638162 RepID=UPI0007802DDA|nr:GGDEF domain-containing protein [Aureimonas sp. AU22]